MDGRAQNTTDGNNQIQENYTKEYSRRKDERTTKRKVLKGNIGGWINFDYITTVTFPLSKKKRVQGRIMKKSTVKERKEHKSTV
jgi:hypothetical protein